MGFVWGLVYLTLLKPDFALSGIFIGTFSFLSPFFFFFSFFALYMGTRNISLSLRSSVGRKMAQLDDRRHLTRDLRVRRL